MRVPLLRHQVLYGLLLYGLLLLLASNAGFPLDLDYFARWAIYSFEHGLGNVYQLADNDYNPLYHYVLWGYGQALGSPQQIRYYAPFLKAFTLLFDFAGAFGAAALVPERGRRFGLALLLLLNAGYLYNTLVWAQVDAIYTGLCFGAVVLAWRQRPAGSAVLYVLGLAAKPQAIIFLPVLLLLWGPPWVRQPRQALRALGAGAATALLVLAPFVWGGWASALPRILYLNLHAAGRYPFISINAYNLWFLLVSSDTLNTTSDALPFAGLTYHKWGLIGFLAAGAGALLPLLRAAWRAGRSPLAGQRPALALVLLTGGLVPLVFCFFNTQMHERYWHAALLFLGAYGFVRGDYGPLVLASAANFLQLESILGHLHLLDYSVLVFRPSFIAGLFALLIGLVFVRLYRLEVGRPAAPTPAAAGP